MTDRLFALIAFQLVVLGFAVPVYSQNARGISSFPPPPEPVPCAASLMTAKEASMILDGHNLYRRQLKLRDLTWDCRMAANAQQWANKRVTVHDEFTPYGESIFVATSATIPIAAAIAGWVGEKPYWNNSSFSCSAGKTCTHYTQMVWRTTAKIGCGLIRNGPGKWKTFLVCNYDPAGNTGGKAY